MYILGIESSCDDTSAAVIHAPDNVLSNIVSSQDKIHSRFGGVVPELASRKHLEVISAITEEALTQAEIKLSNIGLISTTQGPGLIGSLLVGFSYAKAVAYKNSIPIVGVDHMAGHILSVMLEKEKPGFPFIALIVSGGTSSVFYVENETTFQLIGRTRDDAAGEAFDKVAKLLELPYPGGPHVAELATHGSSDSITFPRAWLEEGSYDFSFSGLKTSVLNHCNKQKNRDTPLSKPDICASFQQAVTDVLTTKTISAAIEKKVNTIVLGGGVSANAQLRAEMKLKCKKNNLSLYTPSLEYCTDNAAMVALAGYCKYKGGGNLLSYNEDVYSRSILG